MGKLGLRVLLTLCVFGIAIGQAQALSIDFTDSSFAAYAGTSSFSFTQDGVTVTMQSLSGKFSWSEDDGFGVNGRSWFDEQDEIDCPEAVLVSFSSPVYLTELAFFDLYAEGVLFDYNERGSYKIDDGAAQEFSAVPGAENGALTLNLPYTQASSIYFTAPCCLFENHDYALGGIKADVPEPGSMLLLGSGVLALVRARRRKLI